MPGGVAAAQRVDSPALWIDRAWTLQEAALCPRTYVLLLSLVPPSVRVALSGTAEVTYMTQLRDSDLTIMDLRGLIGARHGSVKIETARTEENEWGVGCLGNGECDHGSRRDATSPDAGDASKRSLPKYMTANLDGASRYGFQCHASARASH